MNYEYIEEQYRSGLEDHPHNSVEYRGYLGKIREEIVRNSDISKPEAFRALQVLSDGEIEEGFEKLKQALEE